MINKYNSRHNTHRISVICVRSSYSGKTALLLCSVDETKSVPSNSRPCCCYGVINVCLSGGALTLDDDMFCASEPHRAATFQVWCPALHFIGPSELYYNEAGSPQVVQCTRYANATGNANIFMQADDHAPALLIAFSLLPQPQSAPARLLTVRLDVELACHAKPGALLTPYTHRARTTRQYDSEALGHTVGMGSHAGAAMGVLKASSSTQTLLCYLVYLYP